MSGFTKCSTPQEAIGYFAYPDHGIPYILTGIAKLSPRHLLQPMLCPAVPTFESDAGKLGCMIDVASAEESVNRDLLEPDMKRTSATIALDDGEFRKLLTELGTGLW